MTSLKSLMIATSIVAGSLASAPAVMAQGIPADGVCSVGSTAPITEHTGEAAWHAVCAGQYVGIALDNFAHLFEAQRASAFLNARTGFRFSYSGDFVPCNPDVCGSSEVPRIQNVRPGTQF